MSSSIPTLTSRHVTACLDVETKHYPPTSESDSSFDGAGKSRLAGHASEEVAMQNVTATPATALAPLLDTHETWLGRRSEAASASGSATTRSNTTRLSRHVTARDLHPGDVVQQHDWSLHVREVEVSQAVVAIAVTEFGFPLHYAADARITLAA
jgi:hypothetical protein